MNASARIFLAILLLVLTQPVWARMYQWVDPDSGTTQLSGMPPAWYRGDEKGPRVWVFENGQLVDDTGIAVSEAERERLRREAFIRSQQDQDAYMKKLLEAKRMKAAIDKKKGVEEIEPEIDVPPPEPEAEPAQQAEQPKGPNAEDLRALIDAWEKVRTESARKALGDSDPPAGTSPPSAPPPQP